MDADVDLVVSASQGPMRSLPAKIQRLLSDPEQELGEDEKKPEVRLLNDLKNRLQRLIDDGYLLEPSEIQYPALTAKYWVEEIRELSYDIDSFLDELVHAIAAHKKLRGRIARFRERRSRSRWVAKEISQFLAHLGEAVQRYNNYNLGQHKTEPAENIDDECPLPPLYGVEAAGLVGIESPLATLEGWLSDEGERRLRVVSIVGFAGVGKTTLANELYGRLGSKFDCRAFVRSSRKPNIRQLLTSILLQVRRHRPPDASESCNLASTIRAHLQNKKYFIVIDDLWVPSTWDIIHHALPDDNRFSRIITTTEVEVVADRCCGHNSEHIFKMEPLCNEEACKLFSSRFGSNQASITQSLIADSSKELYIKKRIQSEIVSKCGGFPLLTIATASLLAKKLDKEQWHSLWSSLSCNLETNPNIEGMKQVLSLCYDNLPCHLKTCMLYFSLYPEGEIIQKDHLVKLWIAEGFICLKDGKDRKEVASTYFDELLSRGMIQPARIKRSGEVLSCTVHYLILDLIQYKSIEDNFVTTIHHSETNIRLSDKVHRLSLHFGETGGAKQPEKLRLSQIRSLFFFGLFKSLPTTVEFRLLRLLILHLWGDQDNISLDLIMVSKLFGLKHFTIACNVTLNLQGQLQGLQHLDTLKIESRVTEVPKGIVHLPRLLHLSLPGDTILPNEIGDMVSLETLGCYDLSSNSAENVLSLGKLSNLQDLHLTCSTIPCYNLEEKVGCLSSGLSELSNLKSLTILPAAGSTNTNIPCDKLSTISSPPMHLEKLELSPHICIFSRLPRWIGELGKLSVLKIAARELSQDDIDILKKLNFLAALSLYVRTTTHAEKIIFDDKGFNVLRDFKFMCPAFCPAFVKGAIPNVRTLKLGFCAQTLQQCSPVDAGFDNLACAVFSVKVGYISADESVRKFVHSALKDIFGKRGSHPVINVHLVDNNFCGDRKISTVSQEVQLQTPAKTDVLKMGASDENYIIGERSSTEGTKTRDNSWITLPQDSPLPLCSSDAVDLPNSGPSNAEPLPQSTIYNWSCGHFSRPLLTVSDDNEEINARREERERIALDYITKCQRSSCKMISQIASWDTMFELGTKAALLLPFSPIVVAADENEQIRVWNYDDALPVNSFQNHKLSDRGLSKLLLINELDESLLLAASSDGNVRIWKNFAQKGGQKLVTAFSSVQGHRAAGRSIVIDWQQQSGYLYASGDMSSILVWDLDKEQLFSTIQSTADSAISSLSASQVQPGYFAAGFADGSVRIYDARSRDRLVYVASPHAPRTEKVVGIGFQPGFDPYKIVSASQAGDIQFLDVRRAAEPYLTIEAHRGSLTALAVHRYAPVVASGSAKQMIKVFSLEGEQLTIIRYQPSFMGQRIGSVNCLSFHPYKSLLAAGAGDNALVSIYAEENYK